MSLECVNSGAQPDGRDLRGDDARCHAVKQGVTLGDVGHVIQNFVEGQRFSVVRDFCGHGIGRRFHEPPNVLHFGKPGEARCCEPGCSSPSSRW